ncbi:BZ3500_MvSof-1268-A1-R1_Chr9g10829 [Microbotryum saponariae]|uniref:BZ3500_MvSof-1268-A1-R1_Chr9g10829 protein n=1 Tax=Microbotryum saponariae TaxID=289078 RepID=A0A2X0L807_9BASI|nr:BZ3501_MvSof-1269-A2-R1_Chr9g10577 [Microbotryum saponariae]SDA00768.1 BZ3500_MvSof-1268-A1-R1_Chr9g10829 [Microbotryum saponariae]
MTGDSLGRPGPGLVGVCPTRSLLIPPSRTRKPVTVQCIGADLETINLQTLDTWKVQYRHKVVLILLVYLLIPAAPGSDQSAPYTKLLGSSLSASVDALDHATSAIVSSSSVQVDRYPLTPVAGRFEPRRHDHVPPHEPSASPPSIRDLPHDEADRHTLPINFRESNSMLQEATESTSLSSPPPSDLSTPAATRAEDSALTSVPGRSSSSSPASTMDESECPIDYRGRAMCPGVEREHPSFSARSAELSSEFADAVHEFGLWLLSQFLSFRITLSPFKLFVLIIHALSVGQLVALIVEDSIIRTTLANPMPPPFPSAANSFSKRMSRYRWRLEATWSRFWKSILVLGLLLVGGTAVIREGQWGPRNAKRGGWDDVPFAQWVLPAVVEVHEGVSKGPLRDLVLLEACGLMLCLLQPLKHLIPTSILPSTLPPPASLYPPIRINPSSDSSQRKPQHLPPQLQLDSSWLISLFVDVTLSLITLLQLLRCGLLLPTISPLTVPPHLLFHTARGRVHAIVQARMTLLRTIECLFTVFKLFPEEMDTSPTSTNKTSLEGPDDSEWVCTICFEGVSVEDGVDPKAESTTSGGRNDDHMVTRGPMMTVRAKCRLPCGHKCEFGNELLRTCRSKELIHPSKYFRRRPCRLSDPMVPPPNILSMLPRGGGGRNGGALFGLPPLGEEEEDTSDLYPAQVRMGTGSGEMEGVRLRRRVVDLGSPDEVGREPVPGEVA